MRNDIEPDLPVTKTSRLWHGRTDHAWPVVSPERFAFLRNKGEARRLAMQMTRRGDGCRLVDDVPRRPALAGVLVCVAVTVGVGSIIFGITQLATHHTTPAQIGLACAVLIMLAASYFGAPKKPFVMVTADQWVLTLNQIPANEVFENRLWEKAGFTFEEFYDALLALTGMAPVKLVELRRARGTRPWTSGAGPEHLQRMRALDVLDSVTAYADTTTAA